jgi:cardiolipin synthase
MVRFEGPVVRQMHLLFMQDWLTANPGDPVKFDNQAVQHEGGFVAQAVGTGPDIHHGVTAQLFSRLILHAERELIISTPYFVPGETVCDALSAAAFSGVSVTLIVPRRNDSAFVARASHSYYPRLMAAGVKIAKFNGGLLHAKTLTVDGARHLWAHPTWTSGLSTSISRTMCSSLMRGCRHRCAHVRCSTWLHPRPSIRRQWHHGLYPNGCG